MRKYCRYCAFCISGDAYYCFCTRERLSDIHDKGATKYDKHCLHTVSREEAEKRIDDDLETLRKYVDVYDIAISNNPNDMRAAFSRARSVNDNLDFEQVAADFRRKLAEYDAVQTYGNDPQPEKSVTDTTETVADSVATSAKSTLTIN